MTKKILKILRMMTNDLKELEYYSDEAQEEYGVEDAEFDDDLLNISEELAMIEASERLDDDELDILRSVLVYILLRKSTYAREDIFSMVFGEGKRIVWN